MSEFRSRKDILNSLGDNVSNIFNESKNLAIKYGGVLRDIHLIYVILDKVKENSLELQASCEHIRKELEKQKTSNQVLSVPKETQVILNAAIDLAEKEGVKKAELRHLIESLKLNSDSGKKYVDKITPDS
ncbi:MAG: hypothetical protein PHV06_06215, partial [bacterium]|nr:hypothetical protein [bacterium]